MLFKPVWMAFVGAGATLVSFGMAASTVHAAATANASTAIAASDIPVGIRIGIVRFGTPEQKALEKEATPGPDGQQSRLKAAYADSAGRFLYLSSKVCADACLQKWQPALAAAGDRPAGDWSLADMGRKRQWTLGGQRAYFLIDGPLVDQPSVVPAATPTDPSPLGIIVSNEERDEMHLAFVTARIEVPHSIGVAEYRLAPGQILAAGVADNNLMGKPLYAFSGTPQQEQQLPEIFEPQYAPTLALPLGDFTIRERTDGSRQWVFRGSPLYTCACDISTGDLNGKDRVPGLAPAVLLRYPTPAQVAIKSSNLSVGYMVEASTGKTIYFRDRLKDEYTPNHARPLLGTQDPGIGALLNTKHCDAKCERDWHPVWAPRNARAQGYWSVYVRPNGKRQWAYKNSALYTYAKEPPGSLDGNEIYTIAFDNGLRTKPVPEEFGLGLSWRASVP